MKAVDAVEELAAWCTDMVAPILRPPQSPSIFNLPGTDSISESLAEFKVMEEVRDMKRAKTIIIVSHRLSTVEHCDHLYRIEGGKCYKERGNDAESSTS